MDQYAREVASAIPDLRRYARALTGTTERGDTYVRTCLETIDQEPQWLRRTPFPRKDLFIAFHNVWDKVCESFGADAATVVTHDRHYRGFTAELDRQILLLIDLEGFSPEEAGLILGIGAKEVEQRLASVRTQMRLAPGGRVLIVEDDALIAMDVAESVRSWGHDVRGVAATRKAALDRFARERPNIVLSDICLAGNEDGIATAQTMLETGDATVIFITGFPERLLTGQGFEPAFVMAKPFQPAKLKAMIDQALWLRTSERVTA
ncbi:MAG: response regulator [Alphaproteobacteria bacterium]|nr:response regulator [Alphaproteobacteria bacterium]